MLLRSKHTISILCWYRTPWELGISTGGDVA